MPIAQASPTDFVTAKIFLFAISESYECVALSEHTALQYDTFVHIY